MNYESPQLDRLQEEQRQQKFLKLQSEAERTSAGGLVLLVFSLVVTLPAFIFGGYGSPWFVAGGLFFLVALVYLIVGQLLHIRAALEKQGLK
jgi:hypothetical protein